MSVRPKRDLQLPRDPEAAAVLQREWSAQVEHQDRIDAMQLIAGVDIAYEKLGNRLCAAVAVLDAETLECVDESVFIDSDPHEYIPGLFSLRELPPVLACFALLETRPDVVVCDGHGWAHPRRFGLACHLGLTLDLPTIGCAKQPLIGEFDMPDMRRGCTSRIVHDSEHIGDALRTQDGVRPVYVSVGHRVSLETADALVLRLSPHYRLPETTRAADQRVNALRRALPDRVDI